MIRRLTAKPRRPKFVTYDLEWWPDNLQLRLIGLHDGRRYQPFLDPLEFFREVLTPKYDGYRFYAHYGGRFDIVHFLIPLLKGGYKVEMFFSGSSASRVVVREGKRAWTFCDSQFLFKVSLKKLGKSVGLEKLDCAFDAPLEELMEYNERDCEILFRALEWAADLVEELGGELKYTLASTALALFRRAFLQENIPTMRTLNAMVRPAYVASRVEVITPRLDEGYYHDFNSSFPYSMECAPLPGKLSHVDRQVGELAVFRAEVEVPDVYLPPLPYRQDGRVYFPTGKWEGWFSFPDIEILEESGGRINRIHESYHFHPQSYVGDYVRAVYPLRMKETDPFRKFFLKILLNALYGKFGEREEKERVLMNPPFTSCPHGGEHLSINSRGETVSSCIRMLRPGVFAIKESREIAHAHLPISIYVTARSRALLWRAGNAADGLAYFDTDGLFSKTDFGSSKELGRLKLEHKISDFYALAPKAYAMKAHINYCVECSEYMPGDCPAHGPTSGGPHDVVHVKGFPRLSRSEFEGLAVGVGKEYTQFRGPKMALSLRGDDMRRARNGVEPNGSVLGEDTVTKYMSHACNVCGAYVRGSCPEHGNSSLAFKPLLRPKRCVDGNNSRPWTVAEILSDSHT